MTQGHVLKMLEEPDPVMSVFLVGHLNLEALLNTILEARLVEPTEVLDQGMMFAKKVSLACAIGAVTKEQGRALRAVNKVRNKFAHRLGYTLSFDEAFDLVRVVADSGVDFSDEAIHRDKSKSRQWYGVDGIVRKVLVNVFLDIGMCHIDEVPEISSMVG